MMQPPFCTHPNLQLFGNEVASWPTIPERRSLPIILHLREIFLKLSMNVLILNYVYLGQTRQRRG